MMRNTIVIAATAVFFALAGCAMYGGGTLRSIGDRNLAASEITIEMCRDFALASQAAIHGDDFAFYVLGKASEMRGLSVGLSKHSIQCFSAVERLSREENPMSEFHHGALLQIFKRSWSNTKVLAGEEEE